MRRELLVASAVLRDRQGRILLVGNDWQRSGKVRYTLPGGQVEHGETANEAITREILEETGLKLRRIEHLAYCVHIEDARRSERAIVLAFAAQWEGLLNPRDPDGFIVEARFFDHEEAIALLDTPPMREPLSDYLSTGLPGRFYSFQGWDGKGGLRIPQLERRG
nr:NUDIX hydrolase [Deinobacterium chartae]